MYGAGNLELHARDTSKPVILSFDTISVYNERYRKFIGSSYRYPSSLIALSKFSSNKMLLLKQVGRSAVLEMRTFTNDPIWSKTISLSSKYFEPKSLVITNNNRIAFSAISYLPRASQSLYKGDADSLFFYKFDSVGNILFSHRIKTQNSDSLRALQVYSDKNNVTNFFFLRRCTLPGCQLRYVESGYTLDSLRNSLGDFSYSPYITSTLPETFVNPIQHIQGDTIGDFYAFITQPISPSLRRARSAQSAAGGYPTFYIRGLPKFGVIISVIKVDSLSFLIMGKDSSANALALYFRYGNTDSVKWFTTLGPGVVYNADTSTSSTYVLHQRSNFSWAIYRQNKATGLLQWQKDLAA